MAHSPNDQNRHNCIWLPTISTETQTLGDQTRRTVCTLKFCEYSKRPVTRHPALSLIQLRTNYSRTWSICQARLPVNQPREYYASTHLRWGWRGEGMHAFRNITHARRILSLHTHTNWFDKSEIYKRLCYLLEEIVMLSRYPVGMSRRMPSRPTIPLPKGAHV